jgi:pSer/pThr/pTyr-binding forkhead associated (FHA) protein
MQVQLAVLVGKHKGQKITLPLTQFVIGRDPSCHLRPVSPEVSKFHCAVARSGPRVLVRDLKSTNGTFLNGQRITGTVRVKNGDVLTVGPLKFLFQITEDEEVAAVGPERESMEWLLRPPNEQENEVLDSSSDTTIIKGLPDQKESEQEEVPAQEGPTAVAGELLREQLERRTKQRPTPQEPEEEE